MHFRPDARMWVRRFCLTCVGFRFDSVFMKPSYGRTRGRGPVGSRMMRGHLMWVGGWHLTAIAYRSADFKIIAPGRLSVEPDYRAA